MGDSSLGENSEIIFLFVLFERLIYMQIISGGMKIEEQDCYGLMILKNNRRKGKNNNQLSGQNQELTQPQALELGSRQSLAEYNIPSLAKNSQVNGAPLNLTKVNKKKQESKHQTIDKTQLNRKIPKRKPKKEAQKNKKIDSYLRMKSCSLKQKLSDIEQTQQEDEKELDELVKQNYAKSARYVSDYFLTGFVRNPDQIRRRNLKGEKRIKSCIKHDIKIFSESRNRNIRYTN